MKCECEQEQITGSRTKKKSINAPQTTSESIMNEKENFVEMNDRVIVGIKDSELKQRINETLI